jgi:hypothetical protein
MTRTLFAPTILAVIILTVPDSVPDSYTNDGVGQSKLPEAEAFAEQIFQASEQISAHYVFPLNQRDLKAWIIQGLYQRCNQKVPADIASRVTKISPATTRVSRPGAVVLLMNFQA